MEGMWFKIGQVFVGELISVCNLAQVLVAIDVIGFLKIVLLKS
jgi:hypothetical protein